MIRKIVFVSMSVLIILTFACDLKEKNQGIRKMADLSPSNTKADVLADTKFVYNLNIGKLWKNHKYDRLKDKLYIDSTYKVALTELTGHEKVSLIFPFMFKLFGVEDSSYVKDRQKAYYITKGKKIGRVTPITVLIWGDDYTSITLLLIDKENKPVDGINLFGGLDGGPVDKGDGSIITFMPRISTLKGNEIFSTEITFHEFPDSLKKSTFTDTTFLESTITNEGKIKTFRINKK